MALATAITIGAIGVTLGAVSTTLGIVGSVAQQNQAEANAEMQAQQQEYNKRLEEREAARIEAENAENVRRQRDAAERLKAQQRALLGKSGAAMTSGSPLAILGATAADEELKVQDTHFAGYQEANAHREQAKMFGYQGAVARASAPSRTSMGLAIAGHVLNGVQTANDYLGKAGSIAKM